MHRRILLSPESEAGFAPGSSPTVSTPAESTGAGAPLSAEVGSSAIDSGAMASSGVSADPSQSAPVTVSDAIRKLGLDLPDEVYQRGDYSALQALAERARERDALQEQLRRQDLYARLGQSIAPHVDQFQTYLKQSQAPAQPERQPWEAPVDPRQIDQLMLFVDRDEATGVYVAKPGVDPAIARKVNEHNEWTRDFLRDPGSMIQKAAEHVAQKMFDQRFEERYQQAERGRQIQQIMTENAPWLYQVNPDGSPVRQANGSPALTPAGASYARHVAALDQAGISDPMAKNRLAIQLVKAELYDVNQARATTAQAAASTAAAAQQQALAGSQPSRNPLQALSASQIDGTPGATQPSVRGLSLREAMAAEFARAGISGELPLDGFSG